MSKDRDIEFNNGFLTAIVLFCAHQNFNDMIIDGELDVRMNGASDHLYDIEIPKETSLEMRKDVQELIEQAFESRLSLDRGMPAIRKNDDIFNLGRKIVDKIIKENPGRGMEFLITQENWDKNIKNGRVSQNYIKRLISIDKNVFDLEVVVYYQ